MPDEDISLQVVNTQLAFVREDIQALTKRFDTFNDSKVSHREWAQRNEHVNTRLEGLGREIGELRTEIRAKSAPWWSVGAMICAIAALAYTVLGP